LANIAFFSLILSMGWTQTRPSQPTAVSLEPGIVVEGVAKYSEAERAGLAEGDLILGWSRGDARGEIQSPFDLASIEIEQAPRGTVALEGLRGNEDRVWSLGQDTWGIHARPNFSEAVLTVYREGQALATTGKLNEAAERWRAIAGQAESSDPPWLRSWLFFHLAQLHAEARRWKEADEAYQEAIQSGTASDPDIAAQLLRAWGMTFEQRNDWSHAEQYYRQAMAGRQDTGNEDLVSAVDLDHLASLARRLGDLTKADAYYHQALRIREAWAPASLPVATSLNNLGDLAQYRGDAESAEDFDRQALVIGEKLVPGSLTVAATFGNLGDVAFAHGNLAMAEEYYGRSLEIREKFAPASTDVATAFNRVGEAARQRGDPAKSEQYHRQALAMRNQLAPGSLDVAQSLNNLGTVAFDRGDLAKAEESYREALVIRQRLAPGSLDVAGSFNNVGNVATYRGDLAKAEEYHRQALAIREKLAPGSLGVAASFDNLGIVAWYRGDLAKAEEYQRQALAIREKRAPGSLGVANSLNNLGIVASQHRDLAKAEDYQLKSLAIKQRLAPGSLDVGTSFNNLGVISWHRGDLTKAEDYLLQALAIRQRLAPSSLDVALTLGNLALVALERGNLSQAEGLASRAQAICQKLAPGGLDAATALNNLGLVAREGGDLAKAEDYYQQARDIREKLAPGSVDLAWILSRLGAVVRERGDLERAEQYYRRAFAIWEKLAPRSVNEAESLAGLAKLMRQRGQLDLAGQFYEQALSALEGQTSRLGGSEDVRAVFRAKYDSYYRDYVSLLTARGQTDLAFQVLERSRAQTLLEMLASAHLDIHKGADPGLLRSERSLREDITAKTDRRMRLLSDEHSEEQIAEIDKDIAGLRDQYQSVEAQIRATSPGYAALTQPEPLNAGQVRQLLDQDTVLLEYSLGDERSYLFAVTAEAVAAYELPKRAEIEHVARGVYDLLTARSRAIQGETPAHRQARMANADQDYPGRARQLSNMLLGPAGPALQGKRLLIVADGALHYIPFAALPDPQDLSRTPVPLMAAHEIVNLPSASVLAVMRRQEQERKPAPRAVAVLADPVFSNRDGRLGAAASPQQDRHRTWPESEADSGSDRQLTRSVRDVGLDLSRLPYTRREAEAIFALAPAHQGMKALDFNATRAAAMGPELSQYRIIHFATHGLLNSQHPELSGLVLSLVDKQGKPESGFLSLDGGHLQLESSRRTGSAKRLRNRTRQRNQRRRPDRSDARFYVCRLQSRGRQPVERE
jgi:tetratricopeptide (TPR) repeat protein